MLLAYKIHLQFKKNKDIKGNVLKAYNFTLH